MDTELVEIRDFLAQHAPFDTLPDDVLGGLPARLEVRYFPRGTLILDVGQDTDVMYVLRSGAVDIRDRDGELVERGEAGTSFAMSALIRHGPSIHEFTAIEDSLVLVLPADLFLTLYDQHVTFRDFFDRSHRRRSRRAQVVLAERGGAGLRTRARDLLRRPPQSADVRVTINEAAATMRERGVSSLLLMDAGRLVGIVTDRDLRNRVLAEGRDPAGPVRGVMTADPVTVPADTLAFELLMEMVARNIHHLPLVDGDGVVGMVTSTDLMRLESANPVYLVGDLSKADSTATVAALASRLPRIVQQLVEEAASADDVGRVATAVGDAVERRLLDLALAELGPPPVPFCWVVMGSRARLEQGLASDQDNALILADEASEEDDGYFAALADRVCAGLRRAGYAYCRGDAMATNRRWRQTVTGWRRTFAGWIETPRPEAVLAGSIFFDMRPVHGDTDLFARVEERVLRQAAEQQIFQAHLAKHAVATTPPLGFFRGFVLERGGEHHAALDLKRRGILPIVELARVHALAQGSPQVNTQARLRAAAQTGRIGSDHAADLAEALEFIAQVRLRHQSHQVRTGATPDSYVRPGDLSSLEKRHLRDSFGVVRQAQSALARSLSLHYVS